MNLTKIALERPALVNFIVGILVVGGIFAYFNMGRLEDPDFTIKTAVIVTAYPGASPEEVELEVTDRIERAIQELPETYHLYSFSRAGLSIVKVDIKETVTADEIPQVWDQMRNKIDNIRPSLPLGALPPDIGDDFSFVFGFVLALTGEGYSYSELEHYAKFLRKELNSVQGVARTELWGTQPKVIYLDVSEAQMAALQISREDIMTTLALQNMVVRAGNVQVGDRRLRVEVAGDFSSPKDIGELSIRRTSTDKISGAVRSTEAFTRNLSEQQPLGSARSGSKADVRTGELIRIKDVATVREGYLEPAISQMRFQGKEALAIQLANVAGGNVLVTGEALDEKLQELSAQLPAGIEVEKFVWQSELVDEAIGGFVVSLVQAVLIVFVVIAMFMGIRAGLVIGWALVLTILGTFMVMRGLDIAMQRVSLGALVVALGMMVDNAIVVADNYMIRIKKNMDPVKAAIESAAKPGIALLGATVVAAMAFFPVYVAPHGAGEYGSTLFVVVFVSLLWSWLIALTVTPMNCIALLKAPPKTNDVSDPYTSPFFIRYRKILEGAIRKRVLTISALIAMLILSIVGFKGVPQQFFPDSTRAQFVIDFWAPQGTPISKVSKDLSSIEERLLVDPRVKNVSAFIGLGGPRFYLPVDPEFPYSSYAQLIINTPSFDEVGPLVAELEPWLNEAYPDVLTRVKKYTVGPGDTWPFELRISGPAEANPDTLRSLAAQVEAILHASPYAKHIRTDMRQRTQKVLVNYDQERARWASISRTDVAQGIARATDGTPVGLYREGDSLLPIIARTVDEDRNNLSGQIDLIQVRPSLSLDSTPLGQVTEGIQLEWEDPIITRWDRRRQIAVQATPDGTTYPALRASVIDQINAIELPQGYELFWDGEYFSTVGAQMSLLPGMIPAALVMSLVIVGLFNAVRPAAIIACTIPFAFIGITAILLPTQTPFGFMSLLGAMSLIGLMIKNSIVLLDEIEVNKASGMSPYDATVAAAISRVRPVALGALTTILGVIPLVQDAFWVSMALVIMFGLFVGTLLTLILVPTFYATFFKIRSPEITSKKTSNEYLK